MKLLFLNSAKSWGGNEKWTWMAAQALAERSHLTYIAYRAPCVGEHFSVPGLRLPFLNELDVITLVRLIWFVQKMRIDVIIPTKRKDYVIGGIVARLCGIRNILRLGIVRTVKNRWPERMIYGTWTDGIIVNAGPIRDILMRSAFIPAAKIRVIHNGIDIKHVQELASNKTLNKWSGFVITGMGSLIPRKGFAVLIRAFREFINQEKGVDVCLQIIGEGEERVALEKLTSGLGLSHAVQFLGHLKNPYPYIARSDVFVLASKNEGISNALLENMALKVPVVSSVSGGVNELIVHNMQGLLFNPEDHHMLTKHLVYLYNHPEVRRKLALNGYEKVKNEFSTDLMCEQIVQFCEAAN